MPNSSKINQNIGQISTVLIFLSLLCFSGSQSFTLSEGQTTTFGDLTINVTNITATASISTMICTYLSECSISNKSATLTLTNNLNDFSRNFTLTDGGRIYLNKEDYLLNDSEYTQINITLSSISITATPQCDTNTCTVSNKQAILAFDAPTPTPTPLGDAYSITAISGSTSYTTGTNATVLLFLSKPSPTQVIRDMNITLHQPDNTTTSSGLWLAMSCTPDPTQYKYGEGYTHPTSMDYIGLGYGYNKSFSTTCTYVSPKLLATGVYYIDITVNNIYTIFNITNFTVTPGEADTSTPTPTPLPTSTATLCDYTLITNSSISVGDYTITLVNIENDTPRAYFDIYDLEGVLRDKVVVDSNTTQTAPNTNLKIQLCNAIPSSVANGGLAYISIAGGSTPTPTATAATPTPSPKTSTIPSPVNEAFDWALPSIALAVIVAAGAYFLMTHKK